jgi:nitrate reductase alpha subunit
MPKPTHMIGGYAQLSYGFNYYGTVGSNRDEFVIVRKMHIVDWMDGSTPALTLPLADATHHRHPFAHGTSTPEKAHDASGEQS